MATNIPPHNLREVINAVVKIIDDQIDENGETSIEDILQIIKGPDFPTGPFLQMPLRGYAYVARKKALRIPPNMAVTGRALVVAPYGAVLNDGVQLTGPMVIFSFSDIVVGQGAVLKKVLLFTPKRLIVGDYSQIDGIMAAGRSVTLGEGTRYRRDESLLTPYRTPYIF